MHPHPSAALRAASAVPLLAIAVGLALPTQHVLAQAPAIQHYNVANLTSNLNSLAPVMDPNLINPWGLSRSTNGAWWVSDNATGLSTLYDGAGKVQSLVVAIPAADPSVKAGSPTGTMFNGDPASFQIAPGKNAVFLFVTEDGTISGWNPGVSPRQAIIVVNTKQQSVFKGATIATVDTPQGSRPYLYAADFRRARVAVYDAAFNPVHLGEDSFDDDRMPRVTRRSTSRTSAETVMSPTPSGMAAGTMRSTVQARASSMSSPQQVACSTVSSTAPGSMPPGVWRLHPETSARIAMTSS